MRTKTVGVAALAMYGLALAVISLFAIENVSTSTQGWSLEVASIGFVTLVFMVTMSWYLHGTIYLFQNLYLLCLAVFHFTPIAMDALGKVVESDFVSGYSSRPYAIAGWCVLLAWSGLMLGSAACSLSRKQVLPPNPEIVRQSLRFGYLAGLGLFLASIPMLLWAFASYGNLFEYSRAEIFATRTDTRGFGVFMMLLPSAALAMVICSRGRTQKLFSYGIALVAFLLFMLSGYRSAALFPLVVGIVLWKKSGRHNRAVVIGVAGVVLLLAVSAIGILRSMGSYSELSERNVKDAVERASVEKALVEMGGTLGVLASTISYVPKTDEYRWGYSYVDALVRSVPNVSGKIRKEEGRGAAAQKGFSKEALKKLLPSDWITYRVNRQQFDLGFGVGFSSIAEAYLNFGTIGVVLVFAVFGWFLTWLDRKDILYHPRFFVFCLTMFWPFLRTARNDFENFIKPLIFLSLGLIIWFAFLRISTGKQVIKKRFAY